MGYKIMNRELDAYSLEGWDCIKSYEENKELYINPKYYLYGSVLVQTKRVLSGFSLKFKIYFKNHWYWKPYYHWKYGTYYFHWLFLMSWFEPEYVDKFDKIIKDYLSESKLNNTTLN